MSTAIQAPAGGKSPAFADVLANALGVLWGAAMLGVLALWLSKFEPPVLPPPEPGITPPAPVSPPSVIVVGILWGLSGVGVLMSAWVYLSLRKLSLAADEPGLRRFRQLQGLILIVGGLILAVLGLYLIMTLRLAGFGESVGLCLFALIPLIGGLNLQKGESGDIVSFTLPHSQVLAIVLFVVGGAGILTFLYLTLPLFKVKVGTDWLPELGALVFESLLCITVGVWLFTSQPSERTPLAMRCVLMALGGVTGLILTLQAFFRTILWRQDVLLGGMGAWLGPNSWHIWLCAYVGMIGLAMIFGSMLLARSEVRTQPALRQALYGFNAVASGLLLLAFLTALNVLSSAMFPMTFEWSERGLIYLSSRSQAILGMLRTKPAVTAYVMLPQNSGPLYNDVKNLLDNCVAVAPFDKFTVKYVSPTADEELYYSLTQRFPEIGTEASVEGLRQRISGQVKGRGILLVQGKLPADDLKVKPPHSFIPDRKLLVSKQTPTGEKREFMGEVEIMRDLSFLLRDQKKQKIYVLQGNDELDINVANPRAQSGGAVLRDRLRKDNYEVLGLNFEPQTRAKDKAEAADVIFVQESGPDKRKEVPDNAWALVVLGSKVAPKETLPRYTLDALERYLDRGGRMLVTLGLAVTEGKNPQFKKSGLEDLLKKYGVLADEGIVARAVGSEPFVVIGNVPSTATSEVGRQYLGEAFELAGVRVVRPTTAGKFKAEVLLQCDRKFGQDNRPYLVEPMMDKSVMALFDPRDFLMNRQTLPEKVAAEPVPIAVTVTKEANSPDAPARPQLVVVGNTTDLLGNSSLFFEGRLNYSLFVGALEWMGEREVLPIEPRETKSFTLPAAAPIWRMIMVPFWFMTLGIVGLGTGVWLVRRR